MILDKGTTVLIPCAGKGTRSNLSYPKSLYKIKNKPILIKIIESFDKFNLNFKIIINKKDEKKFKKVLKNFLKRIEFIYQENPIGMGDAILKFKKSKDYKEIKHIILIWGDIPFIKTKTISILIKNHLNNRNDFTLISGMSKNPYTLVKRNKLNKVTSVIEMKNKSSNINYGERDVGLFMFNKIKVINSLTKIKSYHNKKEELSFLKVIGFINSRKSKIEAINIATSREMKSLNYVKDLN